MKKNQTINSSKIIATTALILVFGVSFSQSTKIKPQRTESSTLSSEADQQEKSTLNLQQPITSKEEEK